MLSDGNKYLAHIFVKGLKGKFQPLVNWIETIYISLADIVEFLSNNI